MKTNVKPVVCVVLAALAISACSKKDDNNADVIHWWTSGNESKAIKVIAQSFEARGGVWTDSAVVGTAAARASAINRILGGKPPTSMQWRLGVDLTGLADQGMLAQIDAVAEEGKWSSVLPALIQEKITYKGHVVAAPTAIHGDNWMWTNSKVYASLGLKPPKT